MSAALFPQMSFYFARGRDVARISDVKSLSAKFQEYSRVYTTYPATENPAATDSWYCVTQVFSWPDAVAQIKDKQFSQLGGTWSDKKDPINHIFWVGLCEIAGSYFYNNLNSTHGIVAARMERQTTGANYSATGDLLDITKIDALIKAQPLDKDGDDPAKMFIIITN